MMLFKRIVNKIGRPVGVDPFPRAFPNPIEGQASASTMIAMTSSVHILQTSWQPTTSRDG